MLFLLFPLKSFSNFHTHTHFSVYIGVVQSAFFTHRFHPFITSLSRFSVIFLLCKMQHINPLFTLQCMEIHTIHLNNSLTIEKLAGSGSVQEIKIRSVLQEVNHLFSLRALYILKLHYILGETDDIWISCGAIIQIRQKFGNANM